MTCHDEILCCAQLISAHFKKNRKKVKDLLQRLPHDYGSYQVLRSSGGIELTTNQQMISFQCTLKTSEPPKLIIQFRSEDQRLRTQRNRSLSPELKAEGKHWYLRFKAVREEVLFPYLERISLSVLRPSADRARPTTL